MQVFALPLGIVSALAMVALWVALTPLFNSPLILRFDSMIFPGLGIALLLGMIVVHELIHAFVHPGFGKSVNSVLGIWPSRLLFYAHYHGELSRARFIAILGMPLIVISIVPLLVCALLGQGSVLWAFISIMNALSACGDLFAIGMLLWQVPRTAIVRNQGWRTYWRQR